MIAVGISLTDPLPSLIETNFLWQVGNVSVSCTKMPLLALEYEEPRSQVILLMIFLVLFFDIICLSSANTIHSCLHFAGLQHSKP